MNRKQRVFNRSGWFDEWCHSINDVIPVVQSDSCHVSWCGDGRRWSVVVSKQQTPSTCHQQCVQCSACVCFRTECRELRQDSGRMEKFSLFVIVDRFGMSNPSGWPIPAAWPRVLRRGSVVACLLGLWIRIPPWGWMFVCCECCVLSGSGLRVRLITRPEESYRAWCVWVWSWSLNNEKALAQ